MTLHTLNDSRDRAARQLHSHALQALSAPTLARLRQARRDAAAVTPHRRVHWGLATALSAVLAVIGTWQLLPSASAPTPVADSSAALIVEAPALEFDESPELYLWLGSDNAVALE